jgi:anti-sigma B factor antagonist
VLRQNYSGYELRDCWPSHIHAIWELSTLTARMAGFVSATSGRDANLERFEPLVQTPPRPVWQRGGPMPGIELSTSACDGHVVVALRGDLDITGAANAGAAMAALVIPNRCLITDLAALDFIGCGSLAALLRVQWLAWSAGGDVVLAAPQRHVLQLLALTGMDHAFLIPACVQAAVAGLPGRGARHGGRPRAVSTACSGRVAPARTGLIAVGAAALWAGSFHGWMRGCRQPTHRRVGAAGRACQLGTSRTANTCGQEA